MPSFATSAFRQFFELGRLVSCVLPLGNGRVMHLVVYGYQGAEDDSEKLSLTDQLFDAALCELAVVSRGQPCVLTGDFNVKPTRIPCLLKGIMVGLWFDLQGAWANASGVDPSVTCKKDWVSSGGTRRDFILGCPLATAALDSCWVDCSRWFQPHFSVRASFRGCRWSAKVTQPCKVTPLWPASWVSAVDRSRGSKSAEVRDIWDICDHILQFIPGNEAGAIDDALAVAVILTFLGRPGQLRLIVLLLVPFVCLVGQSLKGGWMLVGVKPVFGLLVLVVRVCGGIDLAWLIPWVLLKFTSFGVNQLPPPPPIDIEEESEVCGVLAFGHHSRRLHLG